MKPAPQSYDLPRSMIARALLAFVCQRQRDTWADASTLIAGLERPPVVLGMEHVPSNGPIVFVPNHYERKDAVWVGWGAMALTAALADTRDRKALGRLHWVMTDTWADCFIGPVHVHPRLLGWVLAAFSRVYGIIRMPAHDLPNHHQQRGRSAGAARELLRCLDLGDCVAVHPEAGGFETLIQPPPGAGRLLAAIDRRGVPMVPVGICEEDDRLVVRIGAQFPAGCFAKGDDRLNAEQAMLAIARLVPERTRGIYARQIAEETDGPRLREQPMPNPSLAIF